MPVEGLCWAGAEFSLVQIGRCFRKRCSWVWLVRDVGCVFGVVIFGFFGLECLWIRWRGVSARWYGLIGLLFVLRCIWRGFFLAAFARERLLFLIGCFAFCFGCVIVVFASGIVINFVDEFTEVYLKFKKIDTKLLNFNCLLNCQIAEFIVIFTWIVIF